MHYTTSCNTQSSAPEDGQNKCPKHVELTGIINKPLLLRLVDCLYYLYQWCIVKQISDNEIYLLIKYIKSVLWRVVKRLSYIEDARCLKVNSALCPTTASFQVTNLLTYLLTYSLTPRSRFSWEVNRFSSIQEIPRIVRNQKVNYSVYSCPPPAPIMNQIALVQDPTFHFLNIQHSIILPSIPVSSKWSLSLRFPHQNLVYNSPLPIRATCHVHLIFLGLIIPKILGEYRSLGSPLHSFLHFPVTSSFLGPKILNTLFSKTLSLRSSLNVRDQDSHSYKTIGKIIILYILIFIFLDSKLEDKIVYTEW